MIRFKSIASQIISLHVVVVGITLVSMPLALDWLMDSTANDLHHRALREISEKIAHHLLPQAAGGWKLDLPPELQQLYSMSYGRYAYTVLDDRGKVLFSSFNDGSPTFPGDRRSPAASFLQARRGDMVLYGASIPRTIHGRTVWIQVGEDLEHSDVLIDDIVADFFRRVGWITIPILLSLLAIDIVIFRRALRHVRRASVMAADIGPERTDVRLPAKDMPSEVLPLVRAVNQALDRLEEGFRMQREFTADAAHELRTPLTILRARIDTLADRKIASTLSRDIAGMSRIVSQLLDIAELETFVVDPREKADLQAVCAELAGFVAPLALAQGKSVALSGAAAPVWVRGNAQVLSQAVRNLVENALNHTPPGTTVDIVVAESGTVSVFDQGPGIPEGERALVFQRFWRRDRRRTGNAGLGLSIVRRIVEAHAGSVTVENRPAGGAAFSISLLCAESGSIAGEAERSPARAALT